MQVITIPDARYEAYRRNPDWIQKHIFPGGLLPSRAILAAAMEKAAGLRVERAESIGRHYAPTLRAWRERFNASAENLRRMGFDDAFKRRWNYYFVYCEAGFATGYIDDWQLVVNAPLEEQKRDVWLSGSASHVSTPRSTAKYRLKHIENLVMRLSSQFIASVRPWK